MTLAIYFAITFGAAGLSLIGRISERLAIAIGLVGLGAASLAAIGIDPNEALRIGGGGLAASAYVRLFLILGTVVGTILALVGLAAGSRRDLPAVTLGTMGAAGLALVLPDARIAVIAATASGLLGVLLTIVPTNGRAGATVGIRVARALVVAGAMAIAATAWIGRDLSELAAQPVVFGLAYLAFALAVAVRFGAIPFHVWAARLTDSVPEAALPIVTAWGPATFAVVALAWTDASIAPLLVEMDAERALILAIAIASIALAAFAAWIQDDLEHIVGYSIIGDAGFVLLAVAALDPDAWAPARTWILAYAVARSAFAAWAAAMRATYFTGRLSDLRGWALRSPVLAVAFVIIAVASIGVPGLAAFDARSDLIQLSLGGPIQGLVLLLAFAPLLYYGRILVIGLRRPDPATTTDGGMAGGPSLSPIDMTDLRGSLGRLWNANRPASAVLGACAIAVLALVVTAGGFGGPAAAAGLAPGLEGPTESFIPGPGDSVDGGSPPASALPGEGSGGPSFAPVPTT